MGAGRVAAIVVTYNRLEKLTATVTRLLSSPSEDLAHLVVVDNASDDGTAAWLAGLEDPRLAVLRLEVNSGGAGGFEAGLAHARDRLDPDWMLLMDDDAHPEPEALARFRAGDRARRDGWAAAVYYPGGGLCEMNRPWVNPFWHVRAFLRTLRRGRAGFHLPTAAYDAPAPTPIDGGSFVGLFLSRRAVKVGGLPDGRLFVYGDDVIYTLGLTARGMRMAFDPALRFEHDCATFDPESQAFRPLWKAYYYHRNLLLAYRRAAGPLFFWPALALILPRWWRMGLRYGADRAAYRRILRRAVRDGLRRDLSLPHEVVVRL
ncbi:glycosyltransferase [Roseisalinus antarcticus]|uniref:Undecaprenyl-phosphate mannosyltransferase n=1 Tax=Roseisalinus antarcticus TaxID=254357 RepID=A0A1Y5TUT8_9RHOB|nr:glycosyltransferase [Roseisalinus antarcticus]SLN68812.1 Undecaprenyl-phosphate mannosyltransferase [Roseisalinus antarcticus]